MEFSITEHIPQRDREAVYRGLLAYNLARLEDKNPRDLGIFWKDAAGDILAGLTGETHGSWLTVQYLWVSETYRGRRIGSALLERAETEARARGCKYAFLNTFGFQAPDFYRKQGYRKAFALEEYPLSGKRYYFTKKL